MRLLQRLKRFMPAVILVAAPHSAASQDSASAPRAGGPLLESVVTVSGDSVDRLRTAQVAGTAPLGGLLLRSTSSLTDRRYAGIAARPVTLVLPQVTLVTNSELPFGQNDGAMWAGKGYNTRVLAGLTATFGPVRIVALPELVSSTNYSMAVDPTDLRFAYPLPGSRSTFSSPFNTVPYSIDLPYRLGEGSMQKVYPGQSSVTVSFGPLQVGAATENEWWGPALRNPLVLSDNAPGFPHAFLRTGRPVATGIGQLEGRLILGGLHESDWFDNDFTNDVRSLSAFALTWKRRPTSGLTVGLARSVFAPVDGYSGVPANAFDFITGTGRPNALPVGDSTMTPGPDQIFSLFAQWVLPRYGLESYLEWGRTEFPKSLRDFLMEPHHTRGYTAGLQWVRRAASGSMFRFQGELTNIEQSSTYRFGPIGSFYTSRAVIQGYTNEGQVLGAGIGPGSSGQWFAADYFRGGLQLGLNLGRTRFNNDAFFLIKNPNRCFHDVTVYPGARAGLSSRLLRVSLQYSAATRYNTFFQRVRSCDPGPLAIGDRSNNYFSLTLTTLGW